MNKAKVQSITSLEDVPKFNNMKSHLCFDCKNGCPSRCEKVKDIVKKPINEYDFIIDGVQTLDENGDVDRFAVFKCENFKRAPYKAPKLTSEESAHISKVKLQMLTCFFDTDSAAHANEKQYYLYMNDLIDMNDTQMMKTNALYNQLSREYDLAKSQLRNVEKYGTHAEKEIALERFNKAKAKVKVRK